MIWNREIDYHGSRSYGVDGPKARRFRVIAEWLAKLGGRKNTNSGSRPTRALPARLQRDFPSLAHRPADCPFPLKPRHFESRDWRLLP